MLSSSQAPSLKIFRREFSDNVPHLSQYVLSLYHAGWFSSLRKEFAQKRRFVVGSSVSTPPVPLIYALLGTERGAGNRAKHLIIMQQARNKKESLGLRYRQHSLEKWAGAEGGETTRRERCVAFFYERSRCER
jgi:hypothetical protein